jgi:hypothetical protein
VETHNIKLQTDVETYNVKYKNGPETAHNSEYVQKEWSQTKHLTQVQNCALPLKTQGERKKPRANTAYRVRVQL